MPPAVVATILAVGDLALMGLELPTGWFADRCGHRASLIVGSFLQVLGMTWCWLGEGVWGLVTASVLVALGDGFRSGADHAFLYRTCLVLNREADFQKIQARAEAFRKRCARRVGSLRRGARSGRRLCIRLACRDNALFRRRRDRVRHGGASGAVGYCGRRRRTERQGAGSLQGPCNGHHAGRAPRRRGVGCIISRANDRNEQSRSCHTSCCRADGSRSGWIRSGLTTSGRHVARSQWVSARRIASVLQCDDNAAKPAPYRACAWVSGRGCTTASRSRHSAIGWRRHTRPGCVGSERVRHGDKYDGVATSRPLA